MAKLAREANVNIKTGNLTYAAAGIEQLRSALDAAAAEAAQRKADADAARLAWEALFREVEPRYLKVVSTPSPEVDRLRTIMTFATDKARRATTPRRPPPCSDLNRCCKPPRPAQT